MPGTQDNADVIIGPAVSWMFMSDAQQERGAVAGLLLTSDRREGPSVESIASSSAMLLGSNGVCDDHLITTPLTDPPGTDYEDIQDIHRNWNRQVDVIC